MSSIHFEDYLDTYRVLAEAIEGFSPEELTWKPSPESWSITEVLGHLADHNLIVSFRLRDVLAGTTVQLPAFNQDAWVQGQKTNESSAADILEVFRALLQYNSLLFKRLDERDWEKTGVNARGETLTTTTIITGFIRHVHQHIGQIGRIRQALLSASGSGEVTQA